MGARGHSNDSKQPVPATSPWCTCATSLPGTSPSCRLAERVNTDQWSLSAGGVGVASRWEQRVLQASIAALRVAGQLARESAFRRLRLRALQVAESAHSNHSALEGVQRPRRRSM
jgi:hypothetical protein